MEPPPGHDEQPARETDRVWTMRPLRVAMVGPFGLHPKGTMRARAMPAARALAARGHRVLVAMPPWHTPDEAGTVWVDQGVGVRYVSLAGLGVPFLGHGIVGLRLGRVAMSWQPDVIHAFKPKAYSGLAADVGRLARPFGGGPALVVDTDDWEGPGGWNDVEPYSPAMRRVFTWQERWGLRHADVVTAASRALAERVAEMGQKHVVYLPNAVGSVPRTPKASRVLRSADAASAPPGPTGLVHDSDASSESGGVTARARHGMLLYTRFVEFEPPRIIDLLAEVRSAVPDARLVVAGAGFRGEEHHLLALAAERGLGAAVEVRGWVDTADLAALVEACDVAIYPMDETLLNRTKSPMKLLELMSHGAAVVADGTGEARHWIEDGSSGVLVPPGDTTSAAAAVVSLFGDEAARSWLGAGARRRIERSFMWDTRVLELERAYLAALRVRAQG